RLAAAHLLMARLRLASGQADLAREHAARAAGNDDATAEAVLLHAGILVRAGDLDEAERQLTRLVAADPDGLPIAELRARIPGADPRWIGLADAYLAAARKEPPDAFDLLQKQAYLRHLQYRHEDELKLYDAMLALRPSNYTFLNNMAWTLSESMNRPEDGLKQ